MAERIRTEMDALGFRDVRIDDAGNVVGRILGSGGAPPVLLNCHTDVVAEGDPAEWEHPPGLFDLLDEAYGQGAHRVEVEFHASQGYPTHLWIDYHENIADEELGFTLLSEVEPSGRGSAAASD